MAADLAGDDVVGSISSRRSWITESFREVRYVPPDVFQQSERKVEDEEELRLAAIERLPTYEGMRKGVLKQVLGNGRVRHDELKIAKLAAEDKKQLLERVLKVVEHDNERFLSRLRERIDRVGIEIPKIEVRFEHLSIEADAHVGSRALPTLLNSTLNGVEDHLLITDKHPLSAGAFLGLIGLAPSKKRINNILSNVSGIVKPSRWVNNFSLLHLAIHSRKSGPPNSGKTTLLQALSGKTDKKLRVNGKITYCGHEFSEFVPQRTCAYIGQHDVHYGEMTVRETMDFSGRCLGVGMRYDLLLELSKREKDAGVKPDPEIEAFMNASAVVGQETNVVTAYALKVLGLDICADIMVGDEMRRGISGGQKKRVTTGEMLVGPANVFFMDEISTGLDSSTTFQIVKFMKQMVHIMDVTMIISLLQPAPETFGLFDDLILLSEGCIVYQGPRDNVLEFFEFVGFKCPERKAVADFLQEVTSKKDQEQYWFKRDQFYRYISPAEFVQHFKSFHIGRQLSESLATPYEKSKAHPAALVTEKYGISNWELFKACLSREWLLMKRNSFVYIFKTVQITILSIIAMTVFLRTEMKHGQVVDGGKFYGALFFSLINMLFNGMAELAMTVFRLPVFYKQRDFLFYPAWAFALPIWLLRIPLSLMESGIWVILTYYTIGFAPDAIRFFQQFLAFFGVHQVALSLFRFIAAAGRSYVVANTVGTCTTLVAFLLGGFIVSKDDIKPWMIWGYYLSPMMYGQNAVSINEFLDERWSSPANDRITQEPTVGKVLLRSRGMFTEEYWYWICVGALLGFSLLFNICFIAALTYLNRDSKSVVAFEDDEGVASSSSNRKHWSKATYVSSAASLMSEDIGMAVNRSPENVRSCSDVGEHLPRRGMVLPFRPLSLAFNHVNYYVNMPAEMKSQGINECRLQLLRNVCGAFRPGVLTALVGVSGAGKTTLMDVLAGRKTGGYIEGTISISGYPKNQETFARISGYCEQNDIHSPNVTVYESLLYSAWLRLAPEIQKETRKMFVDEVMALVELNPLRDALVGLPGVDGLSTEQRKRLTIAVELVANPSIIFMDEPTSGLDARAAAIVMRTVRNTVDTGRTVVCTIHQPSIDIFESFDEAIPGVPKIKDDYNPATWMLEVTTPSIEVQLEVDFAEIYCKSTLYQTNQQLINELSTPEAGSHDLYFPTKYSQTFATQCDEMKKQQDLLNLLGAMYAAVLFLGATNCTAVQPVLAVERTVFYRERAAGMYSALPYAISAVAIEVVYVAVQTFIYTILLYSMIGFEWQPAKFFWFYYYIFMCFIYFVMYGMMAVALTPGHQTAAICASFFFTVWNLFSGFLIPRQQIPIWWRWYYWACPVAWTLYGLVTSQVGDKDDLLDIPGQESKPSVKAFLKEYLGYDYDFLGFVALAHVGFVLLFLFVFAYGIKFLNFQRR
ncbi:hypothetical protein Syun_002600 [Stephania yunnanensis]|uniref:ABC transporter domain-containing protein n=1 Tax=Stephania yunnanensis TaxID=152371 RepID=A0AAP0LIY7_9MAGN